MSTATTAPQFVALVDVDDLEDGDLAARIAEIGMPAAPAPRRSVPASPAGRQAEIDAVVTAWTVVRDRRTAVHAHRLGARAAALVA
ncbi:MULTISPECIES: hypothetical protein [unclassified Blastococcus]